MHFFEIQVAGLRPLPLLLILWSVDFSLVLLHYWLFDEVFMADLNYERGGGAIWGATKFALAGWLVWIGATTAPHGRRKTFLKVFALGLMFLAADEILAIHEKITIVNAWIGGPIPTISGKGAWIASYAAIAVLLCVYFSKAILETMRLDPVPTALIFAGFVTVITGAVGVEVMGYLRLIETHFIQVMIEEALELMGTSLILAGAYVYAKSTDPIAKDRRQGFRR